MHELSIAQEILSSARGGAEHGPGAHLERVRVAVGELTGIEPELLRFRLGGAPAEGGTPAHDSTWSGGPPASSVPPVACPRHGRPGAWLPVCGDCGDRGESSGGRSWTCCR